MAVATFADAVAPEGGAYVPALGVDGAVAVDAAVVAVVVEEHVVAVEHVVVHAAVHDLACTRPGAEGYCCIGRVVGWDTGFPGAAPSFKLKSEKK